MDGGRCRRRCGADWRDLGCQRSELRDSQPQAGGRAGPDHPGRDRALPIAAANAAGRRPGNSRARCHRAWQRRPGYLSAATRTGRGAQHSAQLRLVVGTATGTTATATSPGLPLDSVATVLSSATFPAMGTSITVAVADSLALRPALAAAREVVTRIDETCSRFKPRSELSRLNCAAGGAPRQVSPLLADAIAAALDAAAATNGVVDPTVGRLIERLGYTVTFGDLELEGPSIEVERRAAPGWNTVLFDAGASTVQLPDGAALDLGAVGKAWAADRAAVAAAQETGCGVLVSCGGDVAVAGPVAAEGWRVRVSERPDLDEWQDVLIFDGGIATSGTAARRWRRGNRVYHHILDPLTGLPAESPWRMVSVAASSCAGANAAATAAIILGAVAPEWLDDLHLPARLVDMGGEVRIVGDWPRAN